MSVTRKNLYAEVWVEDPTVLEDASERASVVPEGARLLRLSVAVFRMASSSG